MCLKICQSPPLLICNRDDVTWSAEQLEHAERGVRQHNEFADARNAAHGQAQADPLSCVAFESDSDDSPRSHQMHAWDEFYSMHQGNFFKNRQWLPSEFPELFQFGKPDTDAGNLKPPKIVRILETGCGAGATVMPLLDLLPAGNIMLYCCDISSNAIVLLRKRITDSGDEHRCTPFQADIGTNNKDDCSRWPCEPESIDFILLLYTLSALHPSRMPQVIRNLHALLRPGGVVFFRDYGMYDLAQLRFKPNRCLSENLYQRSDGTTTYFFTREKLRELFVGNTTEEITRFDEVSCIENRRLLVNRKRELKMYRVWIQAKYSKRTNNTLDEIVLPDDADVDNNNNNNNNRWRGKKVARTTARMREKLAALHAEAIDDAEADLKESDHTSSIVVIYNAGTKCGFSTENVEIILHDCIKSVPAIASQPPNFCVLHASRRELDNCVIVMCDTAQIARNLCRTVHGRLFAPPAGSKARETMWVACRIANIPGAASSFGLAKSYAVLKQQLPTGLLLLENFVSSEMEQNLLDFVRSELSLLPNTERTSTDDGNNQFMHANRAAAYDQLKRRTALHYGSRFVYDTNTVSTPGNSDTVIPDIPPICQSLFEKIYASFSAQSRHHELDSSINFKFSASSDYFNQLTINIYEPGGGIPAHTDIPEFGECLVSLSLGSDTVMDFQRNPATTTTPHEQPSAVDEFSLILPARSLLVLYGDARWRWTHAIKSRKCDSIQRQDSSVSTENSLLPRVVRRGRRCSFTFRHVVAEGSAMPTSDAHATKQLARSNSYAIENDKNITPNNIDPAACHALERQHVMAVYDRIAQKFSATRYKAWSRVAQYLDALPPGALVLDAGCGNGKYAHYAVNKRLPIRVVGFDFSAPLVDICMHNCNTPTIEAFQADVLHLPLRPATFEAVICIAVLHHLSSHERRVLALRRLFECLCTGGTLLVYVWAFEQRDAACGDGDDACTHRKASKYVAKRDAVLQRLQVDEEKSHELRLDPCGSTLTLPIHTNRTDFKHQDVLVPFSVNTGATGSNESEEKDAVGSKNNTFYRFYHVFVRGELEQLCSDALKLGGDLLHELVESYYDQGNWCVILRRLS